MPEIFVTADTHFNHRNCALLFRGFDSVDGMNELIITNWNKIVNKRDVVWHLGDVALSQTGINMMKELNGIKHLVLGNHEYHRVQRYLDHFNHIKASHIMKGIGVFTHIPIHELQLRFRFKLPNLHGHIHDVKFNPKGPYYNVNTEHHEYTPIPLDILKEKLLKWMYEPPPGGPWHSPSGASTYKEK